jgi:nucleotidyltransferase substrate binding protein (TIGR01987 family)
MSDLSLDLTPFNQVLVRLREGITRYARDPSDTQIRDGLIRRFVFTYEISHKMLRRYLKQASATPEEYDRIAFQDLIRAANEQGLPLGDWPQWKNYREMRSKTSHTYDESISMEVVAQIPAFLEEATYLRDQIQSRLP